MKKCSCLAVLMLLIGSSLILPASSQEQVTQTVYVYDGDFNGTLLSGVQVAGQDAAGKSFSGITDSNGVAVVSGQPGTWLFVFIKDGYETLDLSYNVTETNEGAVYLAKSNQLTEQIAPSLDNQQPETVSKAITAYKTQLETNATALIQTASSQDQVSQTVYVYDGDFNGTLLSGVQVDGQDAAATSFSGITDSNGATVVSGQPGTWRFEFIKDGYETLELSYNVTETGEGAVYLAKSEETREPIAPSLNNQQPQAISEDNATDETQREIQNLTALQKTEINQPETVSAESWLEKGNYLYEQGRYDEAAQSYDRCILLNPQLEAAWFNKGNALYMQGNYDNALSAFDKAIEINPQDANAWICRGLTLKKLDRTIEANAALMQAKGLGYTG
ncbi:MAG: tetratricopeptide repeat protein [Methanothrix sp.]|nr:tetratricopeptide repeat protein [Methanothrix sp.]